MSDGDYEVGYKRPPREHRFKPGRSGNPKGRPKGARTLPEEVRAAFRKTITVVEDGRRRKLTIVEAALRRLSEQAIAKGDLRAIRQLLSLAESYGVEVPQSANSAEDQALIASALSRLADARDEQ